LLGLLCGGVRKGIPKRVEDSEVQVMKSKRYGVCKAQHAESTIKSNIKIWAKERESFDGISRSKQEIEKIVAEQLQAIAEGDAESACQFTNCEREF